MEDTGSLAHHLLVPFFQLTETLEAPFERLLSDMCQREGRPICIIADVLFGWTVGVAEKLGIFHAVFLTVALMRWPRFSPFV